MKKIKKLFHFISYLQYPLLLISLFYAVKPYYDIFITNNKETIFINLNTALIFMGIAISFSTLQDTTKTQNNFSKRVWENRKKGSTFLFIMLFLTLLIFSVGFIGYFTTKIKTLEELSIGLIVLGIGFVGLLKTAIEMYENHRKD